MKPTFRTAGAAAALALATAAGCGPAKPPDPGVPVGAALLTDLTKPLAGGSAADAADSYELPSTGALYVVDVSDQRVLYSGAVAEGTVLKLSWGGVVLSGRLPTKSTVFKTVPRYERQVARYLPGRRYRVYYQAGAEPVDPTSDEGSPLTRPFQTRDRQLDPTAGQRPTK